MKLTTVEWIDAHASHGANERIVTLEGSLIICPCGDTHAYSADSLLVDDSSAIQRVLELSRMNADAVQECELKLRQLCET